MKADNPVESFPLLRRKTKQLRVGKVGLPPLTLDATQSQRGQATLPNPEIPGPVLLTELCASSTNLPLRRCE